MDKIREIMFKSLEEDLSKDEKILLDIKLAKSEGLRNELKDYKLLSRGLKNINYKFDNNFTETLLGRIQEKIDLFGSFKKIAFASAAAIAILIASAFLLDGSINIDTLFGLHQYPVEEEFYALLNF